MSEKTKHSSNVNIALSDYDKDALIMYYIDNKFSKTSKAVFKEMFQNNNDIKAVLYNAVINETVNIILAKYIKQEENYQSIPIEDRSKFIVAEGKYCKDEMNAFEEARESVLKKRKAFMLDWLKK